MFSVSCGSSGKIADLKGLGFGKSDLDSSPNEFGSPDFKLKEIKVFAVTDQTAQSQDVDSFGP
jgi:hypothetical protein